MNIYFSRYEMKNTKKCKTWRELANHVKHWVFEWNFCLRTQLREHISRNQIQNRAIHAQSSVVGWKKIHISFLASTIKGIVSMGKLAFVNAMCLRDWGNFILVHATNIPYSFTSWEVVQWYSRCYISRDPMDFIYNMRISPNNDIISCVWLLQYPQYFE